MKQVSNKNDGYELDIGDDLMAAALAAVDARMKPKKPSPEEMETFAGDLAIDVEEFDDADEIQIDLEFDPEESEAPELEIIIEDPDPEDDQDHAQLEAECNRLRKLLKTSEAAGLAVKQESDEALAQLRQHMARAERNREKIRRLGSDAENAREARDAAEDRNRSLRQSLDKLQGDLGLSLERRRRDLKEQREQDTHKIVTSFFPVVDHLQLALKHAEADPSTLLKGVQMVMGQFLKSLGNHGVTPIPSNPGTPFDPRVHDAVSMVEDPEWDPNTVIDTVQVGYQLKGRLIRAARVVVSTADSVFDDAVEDNAAPVEEAQESEAPGVEEDLNGGPDPTDEEDYEVEAETADPVTEEPEDEVPGEIET